MGLGKYFNDLLVFFLFTFSYRRLSCDILQSIVVACEKKTFCVMKSKKVFFRMLQDMQVYLFFVYLEKSCVLFWCPLAPPLPGDKSNKNKDFYLLSLRFLMSQCLHPLFCFIDVSNTNAKSSFVR